MKLYMLLIICLLGTLCSCNKNDEVFREQIVFEIVSLEDWSIVPLFGEDSTVGYYERFTIKIYFEFGPFTFRQYVLIECTEKAIRCEEFRNDANHVKIIQNSPGSKFSITTYIVGEEPGYKLRLDLEGKMSFEQFRSIVETVEFK